MHLQKLLPVLLPTTYAYHWMLASLTAPSNDMSKTPMKHPFKKNILQSNQNGTRL